MDTQRIESIWNAHWGSIQIEDILKNPGRNYYTNSIFFHLTKYIDLNKIKTALEAGCGTGVISFLLSIRKGIKVTCLDI